MSDTIFDKIIRHEIPAKIEYEDDVALAFHDISPQAPVHVLVIPKRKVVNFSELSTLDAEYVGKFFLTVSKVAAQLGLVDKGYRVVLNNGRDGGQSVDYLHAHILGKRSLKWPPG